MQGRRSPAKAADSQRRDPGALLSAIPFAGAAAVFLAIPFESLRPALSLPGQDLTSLEAVAALAFLGWGVALAAGRSRMRLATGLTAPLAALLAAWTASALFAAPYGGAAWLFTGRQAAGFLFFLLVAVSVDSRRRLNRALLCCLAAASVVAALGTLEYFQLPWALRLLEPFRSQLTTIGEQARASATFQYPTIAAMYLEIAFGLALGLLLGASRWTLRWRAAGLTAAGLIGACLIFTVTRAALASAAFCLALASTIAWLRLKDRAALLRFGGLGSGLLLLLFLQAAWSESYWLRLTAPDQRDWYFAEYSVPERLELATGSLVQIPIRVRNAGRASWTPGPETPLRLSYHWLTADGSAVADYEGLRTELPRTVLPGEMITLQVRVQAPGQPGDYILAWDMLIEHLFWFSRESSPSALTRVRVSGDVQEALPPPAPLPRARFLRSRRQLWALALTLFAENPLLGVGTDNFRLVYGEREGLSVFDRTYHAHNLLLEILATAGLAGGLALLWLAARLARLFLRGWKRAPSELLPAFAGIWLAVVAILIHSSVDYFLEFTPTYLMTWGVLGLAVAADRAAGEETRDADRL